MNLLGNLFAFATSHKFITTKGRRRQGTRTTAVSTTLTVDDDLLFVSASGQTVTLPAAASSVVGDEYTIVATFASGTGNILVGAPAGSTITFGSSSVTGATTTVATSAAFQCSMKVKYVAANNWVLHYGG